MALRALTPAGKIWFFCDLWCLWEFSWGEFSVDERFLGSCHRPVLPEGRWKVLEQLPCVLRSGERLAAGSRMPKFIPRLFFLSPLLPLLSHSRALKFVYSIWMSHVYFLAAFTLRSFLAPYVWFVALGEKTLGKCTQIRRYGSGCKQIHKERGSTRASCLYNM